MAVQERALIAQLRRELGKPRGSHVRLGIGDDCALLRCKPSEELLVTTDLCIEGIHFRREWQSSQEIGSWCVARGLSDIAAMGGRPVAALLSLACPPGSSTRWITSFLSGFRSTAERYGASLIGGDTAASPNGVIADVVLLGAVPRGKALLRSGARPGDDIYVSGALGSAAAELRELFAGTRKRRRFVPTPQLELGVRVRKIASAMIDISDGLSTDLTHICEESRVSAALESQLIPVAHGADLNDALHGGDEYQLLFTAPAKKRPPRSAIRIGTIVGLSRFALYLDGKPLSQSGWQHHF